MVLISILLMIAMLASSSYPSPHEWMKQRCSFGLNLCNLMVCPWNSSGKNAGVGWYSLLQGIFPTQGSTWVSCIASRFFTIWGSVASYLLAICMSSLEKLKIELPHDPAILLLGIYPKELKWRSWNDINTPMMIVALFATAEMWKQPNVHWQMIG